MHLLLPNPDLIYPKDARGFGITAGSIALIFEAALAQRYGGRAAGPAADRLRFCRLGKPNPPIFEEARRRAGPLAASGLVMLGDQLGTDIAGAQACGIPSVLVLTGLSRLADCGPGQPRPDFVLPSLLS